MNAGVCIYCGCSEHDGCEGGCAWANPEQTLCSACAIALPLASEYANILGFMAKRRPKELAVAVDHWDALELKHRQVLVMALRGLLEGMRDALLDDIAEETLRAGVELNALASFLHTACPDQIREDESLSANVIRLLEPHVGRRIVLAGGGR